MARSTFTWNYAGWALTFAAIAAACGGSGGGQQPVGNGGSAGLSGSAGASTGGSAGGSTGGDAGSSAGGSAGGDAGPDGDGGVPCVSGPDEDKDIDGFSVNQGDCNDCDANVNPGAIDVYIGGSDGGVGQWGDEDCDGAPGSSASCDDNLQLDDVDPMNGARTIELCQQTGATDKTWGVISAAYVRADGTPFAAPGSQVGIQQDFGMYVHAQGGKRMLALSSGRARTPAQPDACGSHNCYVGTSQVNPPSGFPQTAPNCPSATKINDDVALELNLRAPTNATGYSFDFRFFTFEYPEYVCSQFNDQFIALVSPAPTGANGGNICFDSQNNPVGVNMDFFDVCTGCPEGALQLTGTGFDVWNSAGATVWLKTKSPVVGGEELTIRFAIWDTADPAFDSTILLDNFQWTVDGGTVSVATEAISSPK